MTSNLENYTSSVLKHAMETLVADQSATVENSQGAGDQSSNVGNGQNEGGPRTSGATAQVRANGTVVLAAPAQVKHNTQAIAVPQAGGGVSIVHVAIPNQPVHVQSVIQPGPNQQSVIQAPGGATLQSVQLPKNVILLNKLTGTGSVIHSTDGDASVHPVQLITTAKDEDGGTVTLVSEDPKKRREILARRPSYRKILNELSATDAHGATLTGTPTAVLKEESSEHTMTDSSQEQDNGASTITVGGTQYSTTGLLKAIQLATATQDSGIQGLQTLTMTNTGSGSAIVQYTQGQDGQFFVPVTVSAADLQAYQIRTGASPTSGLTQNVVSNIQTIQNPQQLAEEASRKRELRLLKNREAAKECRRKKKEYIKCLENRVAVLENQNKALIEELKSLKELYCQKND